MQVIEELLRLEQHILCQFLPKTYSHIDYDMAPANVTTIALTSRTLSEFTNNTKKMIQQEKRLILQNEMKRYETMILDYEYQYQQGLMELEQCFIPQTSSASGNGEQLMDMIKNYLIFTTEKILRNVHNNLTTFRTILVRRRRRFLAKHQKVSPSPEVVIDVPPEISFTNNQIAYLSKGKHN